jgi:cysteinyl-tRNA synthetase
MILPHPTEIPTHSCRVPDKRPSRRVILCLFLAIFSLLLLAAVFLYPLLRPCSATHHFSSTLSFLYILQDQDFSSLAHLEPMPDVIVTDATTDGTYATLISPQQAQAIADAGARLVCYLSVGEAEDYRDYWAPGWSTGAVSPPDWLGPENPDWPGNFKVKYWVDSWLDDILAPQISVFASAGCRGLYLDIVDAFWFWGDPVGDSGDKDEASLDVRAAQMQRLILDIALLFEAAQLDLGLSVDAAVFPQNGVAIFDNLTSADAAALLAAVTGWGFESLFGGDSLVSADARDDRAYRSQAVLEIVAEKPSLLVFDVEYTQQSALSGWRRILSCRRAAALLGDTQAAVGVYWAAADASLATVEAQPRCNWC